ncbi:MAG: cyclic nucleotide-binding domain-containing protein [Spirochaetes bacterium]|jgi:CRP/FNR family transcriptional regulator|nr:cyclic nucleotide-binding domain-containing protein [Spirochaetota bacterium]
MPKKVLYYQQGEYIIKEGGQDKRMYIIVEGMVKITLSDGREKIDVATLDKGAFFGEMSLFNDAPRSATATAMSKVKLAYIDNTEQLQKFLYLNPGFAAKMAQIMAKRLAKTNEILIKEFKQVNKYKYLNNVTDMSYLEEK